MLIRVLSTALSLALIAALYVVLRSFAIDDGDALDHASTWAVATMAFMAWFQIMMRK